MSIALFGATGNIGREIRAEALRRGKKVTAVVHNRPLPAEQNLVSVKGDIANEDDVAKIASVMTRSSAPIVLGSAATRRKTRLC